MTSHRNQEAQGAADHQPPSARTYADQDRITMIKSAPIEQDEHFPARDPDKSWQDDPVERARRMAQESYDEGQSIPGFHGPVLAKVPSSIKVRATVIYQPYERALLLPETNCYVSTSRRDRFAALHELAIAHLTAANRADVPLTVAEVLMGAIWNQCMLDAGAPPLMPTILSAVQHRSHHWIAVAPNPTSREELVLYGSVSEDQYGEIREELSRPDREPSSYEDLLRLVVRMGMPTGSNIDRFIGMNANRHPEDPLVVGR